MFLTVKTDIETAQIIPFPDPGRQREDYGWQQIGDVIDGIVKRLAGPTADIIGDNFNRATVAERKRPLAPVACARCVGAGMLKTGVDSIPASSAACSTGALRGGASRRGGSPEFANVD